MLSSMPNCDLRSELEALRQDLYRYRADMNIGGLHFEANVELYKMKIARVEALQAFVNAQFVISKMEQSAIYAAQVERRNTANRRRRRKQRQNWQPAETKPACMDLKPLMTPTPASTIAAAPGPLPGVQNNIKIEHIEMNIVDGRQCRKRKRSRAGHMNTKKAKPLEVKLEDIKQEIE